MSGNGANKTGAKISLLKVQDFNSKIFHCQYVTISLFFSPLLCICKFYKCYTLTVYISLSTDLQSLVKITSLHQSVQSFLPPGRQHVIHILLIHTELLLLQKQIQHNRRPSSRKSEQKTRNIFM